MASVLVPVVYLVIVLGSLLVFSHIYRRRAANKVLDPYFPSHPERNAYITLLGKSDPPASDALLKSALVRRAMADVRRLAQLREDRPALQALLQKGSVGDDLWTSFQAAEKEIEAEIIEVVREANSFVEGWGQLIFQTAQEMLANEKMRTTFEKIATVKADLEVKYGVKAVFGTDQAPVLQITSNPPPNSQKIAGPVSPQGGPQTPALTSPITPSTAASTNGLVPPSSAGGDTASDNESASSPKAGSSKKNKKKNKRK